MNLIKWTIQKPMRSMFSFIITQLAFEIACLNVLYHGKVGLKTQTKLKSYDSYRVADEDRDAGGMVH